MTEDRQRQLESIRRNMCGDCGVGPFKAGRHGGRGVTWRTAGWLLLGLILLGAGIIFVAVAL